MRFSASSTHSEAAYWSMLRAGAAAAAQHRDRCEKP